MQINIDKINATHPQISDALHYIQDHLGECLTLDSVAIQANLSKFYFSSQFKKETGMPFSAYLTYARIQRSKFLLTYSNKSILEIAILLGFNSQSYFATQFKKLTGVTPIAYRRKKDHAI
nr:AraC family transcriptional regulator [Alkalibaculum sporogenes]